MGRCSRAEPKAISFGVWVRLVPNAISVGGDGRNRDVGETLRSPAGGGDRLAASTLHCLAEFAESPTTAASASSAEETGWNPGLGFRSCHAKLLRARADACPLSTTVPSAQTAGLGRRVREMVLEMVPALCRRDAERSAGLGARRDARDAECTLPALDGTIGDALTYADRGDMCVGIRCELPGRGEVPRGLSAPGRRPSRLLLGYSPSVPPTACPWYNRAILSSKRRTASGVPIMTAGTGAAL